MPSTAVAGPDLTAFGSAVRRIRLSRQKTLDEVSATSGVDAGNLSRIERGEQGWSHETLGRIAASLGVTVADFFTEAMRGKVVGVAVEVATTVPIVNIDHIREGKLHAAIRRSTERTKSAVKVGRGAFAFSVRGDAMFPDFHNNETVICDSDVKPDDGNFILVYTGESVIFRRLVLDGGAKMLVASDKRYPAEPLKKTYKILGVARASHRVFL